MLHSNSYNPIHLLAAVEGAVVAAAAAVVVGVVAASVVAVAPRIHHPHHIPYAAAVAEVEDTPSADTHHTYLLHTAAVAGTAAAAGTAVVAVAHTQ